METVSTNPASDLPASLAQRILAADALVLITVTDDGRLETVGVPKNAPFQPGLDAAHAMLQAIADEQPNLIARVSGSLTDADRYRALRTFAVMAQADPVRFEVVNGMLQEFEEGGGLPAEDKRTEADQDRMADFLAHALLETAPAMTAPTTEPDAPAIVLAP